ncbi:alkaline phosphatase 4 precursor [Oxobacter pfennigii]|uniref:Alkaline phosphatase 4 n=1 Tax=Oxobacter pfennigii TaxID=36849 RepID=A0A0P8WT75_9CLOT|nr:alkaline phosphatase [Oxobacter pfennigii]KPU45831.1 alkaline phosphatase 4 precursor [Oxobacter pfennigii]
MNKSLIKKIAAIALTAVIAISGTSAVLSSAQTSANASAKSQTIKYSGKVPKYVFLFIGDGMSYPQFQSAANYLAIKAGAKTEIDGGILDGSRKLGFMNFPVAGSATTYDSSSFTPDSASTATSIATGYKTYSGSINVDETKTIKYETISEKLKKQLDYKIGIITSVTLNHATPAAFYAHQASRNDYYEIGAELITSGFDYFAGGAISGNAGNDGTSPDLYKLAENAGYKVITKQADAAKLTANDGKAIVIAENLADSQALSYEVDRPETEWSLRDYVKKGIEVLDNSKGFFMMVEGGKIDWACHANDAASSIHDTIAFSDAVDEAIAFYNQHPDETLIVVTGDHETGGLTIGYAGTDYDTYFQYLQNQKISYAKYDRDYVAKYVENKTKFTDVLKDVKDLFGLVTADDPSAGENPGLVLSDYEVKQLRDAYEITLATSLAGTYVSNTSGDRYLHYGYQSKPLTVTITHILNHKAGVDFTSYAHTGIPVAVFAQGAGQDLFSGYYDNTDIYKILAAITGVK